MPIQRLFEFVSGQIVSHTPQPQPTVEALRNLKLVAHRGNHESLGHKENTLQAFRSCLDLGLWGVEFDVHWTRDDVPVIHHDENTQRLFPHAPVDLLQTRFADLRRQVQEVPSLEELVELSQGRLHLMLEVKTYLTPRQAQRLREILSALKPIEQFHILSLDPLFFHPLSFWPAQTFLPVAELNVSQLSELALEHGYAGLAGHYMLLSQSRIAQHHGAGQRVATGFARNPAALKREIARGVDWVFTDHPCTLQAWIKSQISP